MITPTIYHIGISGGKDSTACLLWAVYESELPRESLRFSWCDTGNEALETEAFVAALSDHVCVANGLPPIETLRGERDFYELAEHKGRFPSARARFCTQELKIKPTMVHVKRWADAGQEVILVSGVRANESDARGKLLEREYNAVYDCYMYRPLLLWTIENVWAIHARHGIARNPLYDMGMTRVGCLPCVMSRKSEIAAIARVFPERIDRIREAERSGKDHSGGLCTFASPNKVPLRYRSQPWTHPTTGNQIQLAMIDDVVRWATDEYGVRQGELDIEGDAAPVCSDGFGMCE